MKSEKAGELFHAKHTLQPNNLGYCGPDENGRILEHLHASSTSDALTSTLTRFEAAYPFIRMIAKSTGRTPFDPEVTEAYWIGNSLLERVEPSEFFQFAHQGLGSPMSRKEAKALFRELGPLAKPHHTFYVLGMYSRPSVKSSSRSKLLDLMDSCRISWGKVLEVREKTLFVERSPLVLSGGRLGLGRGMRREVGYDSEIAPFSSVKSGDWVSLHWNFACDRLTQRQVRNLKHYTASDMEATNRLAASIKRDE